MCPVSSFFNNCGQRWRRYLISSRISNTCTAHENRTDLNMDMTPLKLDALPTEILRQIVSLIQYEDVLTLLTVNRTFHSICNDWMIYDAIIKNGNSRRGCEWQGPPLTGADSISAWARYALADSKAANTSQWSEMDWIQCGPQLMTLSRKSGNYFTFNRVG